MGKNNLTKVLRNVQTKFKKHSPEILTGIGIVGTCTTIVFAVKATPKALQLIEEKKEEEGLNKLPPVEIVKAAWKPYVPAVVTGTLSFTCLIAASSVNARRHAALATAYTLSESAFKEYKNKVAETIGEDKVQEVRNSIAKDRLEKDPVSKKEIIVTGAGNTLCYDILSGRYFYSNADKIKKAVNAANERMLKYNYVSLNDLYYELDLDNTKLGNELGWQIAQGMITVEFSSQLTEEEIPCLVIDYDRMPVYDFDMWF